jgi:SEC-C motif
MGRINKFGLTDDIPDPIKREVRKRAGFGCVICGLALYDYEHFDPEFADALEHLPDGITLLCGSHHTKKTRGHLSTDAVRRAAAAPFCRKAGYAASELEAGEDPLIVLGTIQGRKVQTLLRIEGEDIVSIRGPEERGGPVRISATFRDSSGNITLQIVDNEWRVNTENWDAECVGPRTTLRSAPRKLSLVLRTDPGKAVVVERLHMIHRGVEIEAKEKDDTVLVLPDGATLKAGGVDFDNCEVGIELADGNIVLGRGGDVTLHRLELSTTNRLVIGAPSSSANRNPRTTPPLLPCPCGSGRDFARCIGLFP